MALHGPRDGEFEPPRRVTLRAQSRPNNNPSLLLFAVCLVTSSVVGLCAGIDLPQVGSSSLHGVGHDCELRSGQCLHKKSAPPGTVHFEAVAPEILALKVRGILVSSVLIMNILKRLLYILREAGVSDVSALSGISGLSLSLIDTTFLYYLLFCSSA